MRKVFLLALILSAAPCFAATWSAPQAGTIITKRQSDVEFKANILRDGVLHHVYVDVASNEADAAGKITAHLKQCFDAESFDGTKVGTITYVPPVATQPPTSAQIAQAKFLTDLRVFIGMNVLVKLGLMATGDKAYTDQKTLVQGELLPAYYPLLAGYSF